MVNNFSKNYKHTIGQDLLDYGWDCINLIFEINAANNDDKGELIKKLSLKFDQLKLRLRMLAETDVIKAKQLAHIYDNYLYSIGEQIGGWENWTKKQ